MVSSCVFNCVRNSVSLRSSMNRTMKIMCHPITPTMTWEFAGHAEGARYITERYGTELGRRAEDHNVDDGDDLTDPFPRKLTFLFDLRSKIVMAKLARVARSALGLPKGSRVHVHLLLLVLCQAGGRDRLLRPFNGLALANVTRALSHAEWLLEHRVAGTKVTEKEAHLRLLLKRARSTQLLDCPGLGHMSLKVCRVEGVNTVDALAREIRHNSPLWVLLAQQLPPETSS
jgi:hypothetical protein